MRVSITGHRPQKLVDPKTGNPDWDGSSDYIRLIRATVAAHLRRLNPEEFITGMALGIDQWTACDAFRLGVPRILAAIPCLHHESRWPEPSRIKYHKILALPRVTTHFVSEKPYYNGCMQDRNEFMVDRADVVIAVWNGTRGGTANCVEYAKSRGKRVIQVDPNLVTLRSGGNIDTFKVEPYKFLSNMAFCPGYIDAMGRSYPTVEHAYQAAKSVSEVWHNQVAAIDDPYVVKKMAKRDLGLGGHLRSTVRPNWQEMSLKVMSGLLLQKFSIERNPMMAQRLLATGDRHIEEGNYWHDNFWGHCDCNPCAEKLGLGVRGHNHLGKLLMKIRTKLGNQVGG